MRFSRLVKLCLKSRGWVAKRSVPPALAGGLRRTSTEKRPCSIHPLTRMVLTPLPVRLLRQGRLLTIFMLLAAAAFTSFAQGNKSKPKPDLSGTWELDRKRSNVGKSNSASPPEQIKITHHDPELTIRKTVIANGQKEERELTYYTDGRGETNPTTAWITANPGSESERPAQTNSKTSWSGDKVVTRSVFVPHTSTAIIEFEITVERRISSDGKTLTETTHTNAKPDRMNNSVFVAGRGIDFKAVYNLVSK